MIIHKEAVPEALQRHWAWHGARMTEKETYKGQTIFYAEGGPHYDAKNHKIVKTDPGPGELLEDDAWMKEGYYVTSWGVQRGEAVIGFPLYFKIDHEINWNKKERRKGRIAAARYAAHQAIDTLLNVGMLEEYSGSILRVH